MCDTHREKDRMNRRRKSGRDKCVTGDLDEEQACQVGEHSVMDVDMGSDGEPAGLAPETPPPDTESPVIFMEPLLPPDEALPTTMLQQSEMSSYPGMPPQINTLLSYGSCLSEAGVLAEVTTDPDVVGEVDIEISSQRSGSLAEEHCLDGQETSNHNQQDISSMIWGGAVSPVSTSGSDSLASQSSPSSSMRSDATATADVSSSPTTTSVMATSIPAPSPGTSTSASHIQPQLQVPYYMPSPFPIPFTPGQPPFLVSGPYPPMSYVPRPAYTYGAPIPGPFQAFQYAPPPPGQHGPYALRPYPYPPWGPYASGAVDANWVDANAQGQVQMQSQGHVQGKTQRKRGRAAAAGEDGLRIVLVQPKGSVDDPAASSITSAITLTPTPGPAGPVSDPCESPPSLSTANSPGAGVSSATHSAVPTDSEGQVATVSLFLKSRLLYGSRAGHIFQRVCSSEGCRRRLPNGALGSLCERCKMRLKRRQEKTKLRLKLEPRKNRLPLRRLEA
jgi:hypothetical protein